MATVQLKNIKKVYPYISGEQKKSKKKADDAPKKKINLQITDEGVVAVQQFSLDIQDKECYDDCEDNGVWTVDIEGEVVR